MPIDSGLLNRLAQGPGFGQAAFQGQLQGEKINQFNRQKQARELAGPALSGDKDALARLGSVDPQTAMRIGQFQTTQQAAQRKERVDLVNRFGSALRDVKDPTAHAQVIQAMERAGVKLEPHERLFANRGALAASTLTEAQRMADDDRDAARRDTAAHRSNVLTQGNRRIGVAEKRAKSANEVVKIDPEGNVTIVNRLTGKVRRPGGQGITAFPPANAKSAVNPSAPQQPTLTKQAGKAVGVGASLIELWNRVAGQAPLVGDALNSPGVTRARKAFKLFERRLTKVMTLSKRFPVAEQKLVKGLLPDISSFNSGPRARDELATLSRGLERLRQDKLAQAGNAKKRSDRRSALVAAKELQGLIDMIGAERGKPRPASPSDIGALRKQFKGKGLVF